MKSKKVTLQQLPNKQKELVAKREKDYQQAKDTAASRVEEILEKEWLEFMLKSRRDETF